MTPDDDVGYYRCPVCDIYRHVTQTGIDWHVRKHHPEEEQG